MSKFHKTTHALIKILHNYIFIIKLHPQNFMLHMHKYHKTTELKIRSL
jgi:hypothetical protein